ncbi:MAG TPA: MoaD/ThiS family protein [Acidimicrobiales bacterium]|nr:MoaD/ThiS family protein [Acidimicrobiales bacterium]
MAEVLLLGPARQAAGASRCDIDADTVGAVCDMLVERFGAGFAAVLGTSRIWVDGRPAASTDAVHADAEVSILPPVSGG